MRLFILTVLLSILSCNNIFAQFNFVPEDVIDSELREILEKNADDKVSVNIMLKSQMDEKVLQASSARATDKESKRQIVVEKLKEFSKETQHEIISILQAEEKNSGVTDISSNWLINMINCTASAEVIYKIAEHPDVFHIFYNKEEKMIWDEKPEPARSTTGMTANITQVNADDVWGLGYTGEGVIVAVIDSGVNYNHVDLKDHLWDGGEQYPNHGYDFVNNDNDPMDDNGHGSHCAGTICGDGTSGTQTGMAPDATLMCIKVLNNKGSGSLQGILNGIQFALDNGADIISLSLGASHPDASTSQYMRSIFVNVLNADVVAAVAAGNDGNRLNLFPVPRNVGSPGNCPPPWLHPDQQANAGALSAVVSVGAVNYNEEPASFSSEGPVTFQNTTDYGDYTLDIFWLYYDNGVHVTNIGTGSVSAVYWGASFPNTEAYAGMTLKKVSIFDAEDSGATSSTPADVTFNIYIGGTDAPSTLVSSQTLTFKGTDSFVEVELSTPVTIDGTQSLWITAYCDVLSYPAAGCAYVGDEKSDWISLDGTTWNHANNTHDLPYTWMIRGFLESSSGEMKMLDMSSNASVEDANFGLIRPDVSAPGVSIVSCDCTTTTGHVTMSGTSMATPCVAGVMALMLNKDPKLTPADICRILETTAVKLSDKKNNKTGSGRIDALAAINKVGVETYTFVGSENDNSWSTASNWLDPTGAAISGVLPDLSKKEIVIDGNAVINNNNNVTAEYITINHGKSLTVDNGASLTINNRVTNSNFDALVINDGAQLFTAENNIVSTFVKNINRPTNWSDDNPDGWQFIASPVYNTPISDFLPSEGDYDLFKYVGSAEKQWDNYKNGFYDSGQTFLQGVGYLASYETQEKAELTGYVHNNSSVNFTVAYNPDNHWSNFYLLGNPFTFDINWNNFTKYNVVDGIARVNNDGSYNYDVTSDIKAGEGFMIMTTDVNPSLSYNYNNSSKEEKEYRFIDVIAYNSEGKDNVIVNFNEEKMPGFRKLDNFNENIANIYLLQDDGKYGINTYQEDIKKIPIYFDAKEMGNYTISIEADGKFDYVHLVDKMTGEDVDMLLEKEYSFMARDNDNPGRFVLKLTADNSDNDLSERFVYVNDDELIFFGVDDDAQINIYDVTGRSIMNLNCDANSRVNVEALNSGMYIIHSLDNHGIRVQKVVL